MKSRSRSVMIIFLSICFAVLIFDAKTGLSSAQDGLRLCIKTVVPSLFPFVFISTILNSHIIGTELKILRPLSKFCRVPKGAESLFLVGILGGYPIGAQCIDTAYRNGSISKDDAARMLGFCNNAGPSFIFGMVGAMFSSPIITWILWLIHILSAIIVARILPAKFCRFTPRAECKAMTISQGLEKSVKTIGCICGWVILFRVVIGFLNRWILWMFPSLLHVGLSGILELTNGIYMLHQVQSEGVRFVLASLFLSLGGMCVALQTSSVTTSVGLGMYFPGKLLQSMISVLISAVIQMYLYENINRWVLPWWAFVITLVIPLIITYIYNRKNNSSFWRINAV